MRALTVLAVGLMLAGCKSETKPDAAAAAKAADPSSSAFAARCVVAASKFYVEGGKGPAFQALQRRRMLWTARYYDIEGKNDAAAKRIVEVFNAVEKEIHGIGRERKNEALQLMLDICEPHES